MRFFVCVALVSTCACRTVSDFPPVSADHPASPEAREASPPELLGPASRVLSPAPRAESATMDSTMPGGRR